MSSNSAGFCLQTTSTRELSVQVSNTQDKVVPGTTVTATNKATNASRSTTTNESGEYTITQLPPGQYGVTVEAQGFSKALLS